MDLWFINKSTTADLISGLSDKIALISIMKATSLYFSIEISLQITQSLFYGWHINLAYGRYLCSVFACGRGGGKHDLDRTQQNR
jgi:hypothetical protein